MAADPGWILSGTKRNTEATEIRVGNVMVVKGNEIEDVKLTFKTNDGWRPITIKNVLIVPQINANLLSVGAIEEKEYRLVF